MSTLGLKPLDSVLLVEKQGALQHVHNAIVIALSMSPQLAGEKGQPAVTVLYVDPDRLRHAGSADYHLAVLRRAEVPHYTHKDVTEGRINWSYSERLFADMRQDDEADAMRAPEDEATQLVNALNAVGIGAETVSAEEAFDAALLWRGYAAGLEGRMIQAGLPRVERIASASLRTYPPTEEEVAAITIPPVDLQMAPAPNAPSENVTAGGTSKAFHSASAWRAYAANLEEAMIGEKNAIPRIASAFRTSPPEPAEYAYLAGYPLRPIDPTPELTASQSEQAEEEHTDGTLTVEHTESTPGVTAEATIEDHAESHA